MSEESKNLKDTEKSSSSTYRTDVSGVSFKVSHSKVTKLITALYMVTDIMDNDEPIRHKLRNLGTDVLSDIHNPREMKASRLEAIMSFLDIASTMNMISDMNCNILKHEFSELKKSVTPRELIPENNPTWLEEFLLEPQQEDLPLPAPANDFGFSQNKDSLKINNPTIGRIGVQKGSTLMKALKTVSDRTPVQQKSVSSSKTFVSDNGHNLDILKRQRREEIILIIKDKSQKDTSNRGVTISDIKAMAKGVLSSTGEKTLQRELVSMTLDGVLKKEGEKRWSRYFLA